MGSGKEGEVYLDEIITKEEITSASDVPSVHIVPTSYNTNTRSSIYVKSEQPLRFKLKKIPNLPNQD